MQLNIGDAKVVLLCNSLIAVPALRELLFYKRLSSVIVPARNKEVAEIIKEFTDEAEVPLITVKRKDFNEKIKEAIAADKPVAVLMMTFPYMIPEETLSLPPKGFINFHYGRLPQYRGPEPVFTQIARQEKQPALTVHIATAGVDDGPVILTETVAYDENDTYGLLQHKLADAGAKLAGVLMKILSFGSVVPATAQDENLASYHTKPVAADLMINWETMDSAAIKALVNACNPWNKGAGALINEQVFGITEVEITKTGPATPAKPGTIIACNKEDGLLVITADNAQLKVNIIYTSKGFFSGYRLAEFGINTGMEFR